MRGYEVTCPIETRLAALRIKLLQPIPYRDVRTQDQHHVRKACVRSVGNFVQNAPRTEHSHHRGLPSASGHLARVAEEACVTIREFVFARLFTRNRDSLPEVRPRL